MAERGAGGGEEGAWLMSVIGIEAKFGNALVLSGLYDTP